MKIKTRADNRTAKTTGRRAKDSLISGAHAAAVRNTIRSLAIEYVSPQTLLPDPENPRIHSKKQILQIAASIKAFGFNMPVLINAAGLVIAGNGRVEAAKALGLISIPAIRVDHLTPAQIRAFAIADNKLTENADWNVPLLAEQFKALSELDLDFNVEVTGFEICEIDLLIENLNAAHPSNEDPADALPGPEAKTQVTQSGDLWILDHHRIFCGDARDKHAYVSLMNVT